MKQETADIIKVSMAAIATAIAIAAFLMIAGCKEKVEKIPTDSVVEEVAEEMVENYLENKLGLDDDSLQDRIDFSFWDDEID